jgi:hypothetical protein
LVLFRLWARLEDQAWKSGLGRQAWARRQVGAVDQRLLQRHPFKKIPGRELN